MVKLLAKLLISKVFWVSLSALLACLFIWFYGPLVRIGEVAPFESVPERAAAIVFVLLVSMKDFLLKALRWRRPETARAKHFRRLNVPSSVFFIPAYAGLIGFCFVVALDYLRAGDALEAHKKQLEELSAKLAMLESQPVSTSAPDLQAGLDAASTAGRSLNVNHAGILISAAPDIDQSKKIAYNQVLRNVLEPRMVAWLEGTMWQNIRNPDFSYQALKVYQMIVGLAPYDAGFVEFWWTEVLPKFAVGDARLSRLGLSHQLAAIERMSLEEARIQADPALVAEALKTVCSIPIAHLAYGVLLSRPEVTKLKEWTPSDAGGPKTAHVFERRSGKSLESGLPGVYTYDGFYQAVVRLAPEIAASLLVDRLVFAGGCDFGEEVSADALTRDILTLYYDDFINSWDTMFRDLRLSPTKNMRDAHLKLDEITKQAGALARLLRAVGSETDLARGASSVRPPSLTTAVSRKLGKLNELIQRANNAAEQLQLNELGVPVSRYFEKFRVLMEEVDGRPSQFEDVRRYLATLSDEIKVIAASPNPDQALEARGGLPSLIRPISNLTRGLPDPIGDWIEGILGDTTLINNKAVIGDLNASWRAEVLPFCQVATRGRYPFSPESASDISMLDFVRLFSPGGLLDDFVENKLAPYIDTVVRPWKWRKDLGLNDDALAAFEQASKIRETLFMDGSEPAITFTIEPIDLSANAGTVKLSVGRQRLTYSHSTTRPTAMTWPAPNGDNLVSLSFEPIDGSTEFVSSEIGAWAMLRMIRTGRSVVTRIPEVPVAHRLRLERQSYSAVFNLVTSSVQSPFSGDLFSDFKCPDALN